MNRARLEQILRRLPQQRVLVVGDVMLDQFLWGRVSRISPEAPVPVVEVTRESYFPGGAANVARNLRAIGAQVQLLGVVGSDTAGEMLRQLLDEQGIDTSGLVTDPQRPTTQKMRVVAHHQQVVRCDRESTAPVSASIQAELLACFGRAVRATDAVIFEDYAKGVLSQNLVDQMQRLADRYRVITAADPTMRQRLRFRHPTVATPNRQEAFAAAGLPYSEPVTPVTEDAALLRAGAALLRLWQPANLVITLGEHGMCLFRRGHPPHHIPTVAREVFDVSGAGDTAVALLTLALAAGANPVEAAEIANHAAGVVVGKIGTATCSIDELRASFRRINRHPAASSGSERRSTAAALPHPRESV